MKKHNILKVILLSILVAVICTWIFPIISYQTGYGIIEDVRSQVGIFTLSSSFTELFHYFYYILLFVIATGIFYGVCYKIPAYRELLDKMVNKFKGKESICLGVMMALIAIIVSVSGLSFGIVFVFPFVISLVLLMGYNKLVAASVTVGSTMIGILGTTLGTNTTNYISSMLSLEATSEIITKVVLLVVGLVLLIYNVLAYAKKTKNNTDKVIELVPGAVKTTEEVKVVKAKEEEVKEEKIDIKTSKRDTVKEDKKKSKGKKSGKKSSTKTRAFDLKSKTGSILKVKPKKAKKARTEKKTKVWPLVVILDLTLIILAVSTFSWATDFNIDIFTKALDAVTEFEIFGFPIFAKILGSVSAFGSWSVGLELPIFLIIVSGLLAFMYGVKFDDYLDGVKDGVRKAFRPALYMFLINLVLYIVVMNPFQLHFIRFFLGLTKGLNVFTMTVSAMIASVLNVDIVYVANGFLPYAASVVTDTTLYPLIGIITQSIYGLVMLVAPTSVILLGTLTYLDVSYGQWLKHIWRLFLEILLVLIVIFLILLLI